MSRPFASSFLIAALLSALVAVSPVRADAANGTASKSPGTPVETAVFAAGCFWCTESDFDKVVGVLDTLSGYTGGTLPNPTYKQVSNGGTGHAEALKVTYDPSVVSYADLLRVYWRNVDALDGDGQFCDRGSQYRPAIFPQDDDQRRLAEASKAAAAKALGQTVAVTIEPTAPFFPAEDYHQGYHERNPVRYGFYRLSCGRDARLDALWSGVPSLDF